MGELIIQEAQEQEEEEGEESETPFEVLEE